MKVSATETINAPIEKVFAAFTDFANMEQKISGIKKMEFLSGDAEAKVGMKWRETRIMFGKEATEEMWITEINDNRNYVVEAESHGTKYRSEYTFVSKGDQTEVTLVFEGTPTNWLASVGSLMMIFFSGNVKKAFAQDLTDIKKHIESA